MRAGMSSGDLGSLPNDSRATVHPTARPRPQQSHFPFCGNRMECCPRAGRAGRSPDSGARLREREESFSTGATRLKRATSPVWQPDALHKDQSVGIGSEGRSGEGGGVICPNNGTPFPEIGSCLPALSFPGICSSPRLAPSLMGNRHSRHRFCSKNSPLSVRRLTSTPPEQHAASE